VAVRWKQFKREKNFELQIFQLIIVIYG